MYIPWLCWQAESGVVVVAAVIVVEETELVTGEPGVAWEWGEPVTAVGGELTPTCQLKYCVISKTKL